MKSRILTFGYRIALIALVSLWLAAGDSKAQLGRQELPHALTTRALSPHFEHLSIEDGLSQLSVYSMHQDSRGFIWIGTQDGLNRYDGYEFKIYRHAPYDSASLTQGWVWDIKEDPAGNIWAVTHTGVSRIDAITGLVTRHLNEPNEWVFTTLEIDRNGTVWVGSSGDGLFAIPYDDVDGVIHYVADRDSDETISANRVGAMLEDTRGRILVDVFDDDNTWLNIIDPDRPGIFERRPVADSLRGVWHERPEEPGIFWAGVRPGRMMRIDLNAEEHVVYDLEPGNELDITSIEQDPNNPNILWLAIDGGGLGRFDIRSGAFSRYRAERDNPNSLSSNTATELLVDRSGIIWVGTHLSGVDRFNPASIGFEHIREDLNGEIGLAASSVWAIYQTRDGVVWASTQDDENNYFLSRIDRERGASTHFSAVDDDPNRVPTGAISGMLEDDEGRLWLATSQGLGIIDRQTGRFTAMGPTERLRACCLVQSQTGAIWYRGGTDLIKIEQDGRYELTMGGLSNVSWGDIKEDQAGYLWTAEFDLRKFDPVTGKSEVIDLNPSADLTASLAPILSLQFSRSEQNILWFATFGAGLGRLDTRSGDVRYLTVRDGLPNDALYAVLEDDSGRLWFSSNRGLTRYNPRTGEIRNYGTEIGLQSLEFNTWAGHRGPFGELFFGGPNGLNAFFPNALTENDTPPEVSIVDLKLSNKSVRETGEIVLDRPLEETEAVTLRYEQNDLTLDFVAFHYQHSDLNRFAYKLEGFNDDWIDAGDQRSATYTNLAPGEYTFQVKAANSDGVWNEEGTSLRVIVLPPWWRSWWAYLVYGLVLAAGVFGVDRTQRARLIRKENERAREKELEHAKEIESAYNELRSTQDRLIQSEKMASLGQLTAGIAHEIKNPLNFVNNFSDVTAELADELAAEVKSLKAELPPDRLDEVESILASLSLNAKKIGEHGKRADGIVQNMLEHSKFGEGERAPTDINNLLDEYATLALHGFKARNGDFEIAVERDLDQSIGRINIVPQEMGRVFMNLIGNAFDALRESNVERRTSNVGAVVTVSTSRKDGHVEIRISDNGPGIPDNLKSKIFEPFFTTKPTGSGTGLGLSMSYDIVTKGHGGQLDVESVEGNGATFIITLPT